MLIASRSSMPPSSGCNDLFPYPLTIPWCAFLCSDLILERPIDSNWAWVMPDQTHDDIAHKEKNEVFGEAEHVSVLKRTSNNFTLDIRSCANYYC